MKNKKKRNMDMGTLALTGVISIILAFSFLMLAAIITDTDITLWDRAKAIPVFVMISGLIWWYFMSNESKRECKRLKKA